MMYVIHAMEQVYSGLHGIEDWSICDCDSIKEVEEIGYENSIEVINSYSNVYETLETDIQNIIKDEEDPIHPWTEKAIDDLRDEIYNEDVMFECWKVKEKIANNFTVEELEKCLCNDPEGFIEEYCEKQLL